MSDQLPTVAMVGAGQLARMTHQAAIALGQSLRILAGSSDESAALVATDVQLGDHTDLGALRRVAKGATALTFDHEHVPLEHLEVLALEGVSVYPPPSALRYAQDKLAMRRRMDELGLPNPPWSHVVAPEDAVAFGAQHNWPVVVKTARGGYDGKGVWTVNNAEDALRLCTELLAAGAQVLVEQRVPLVRELAAVVARSPYGQVSAWPVVETVQRDGICVEVLAPAPDLDEDLAVAAQHLAITVATELGVVGVLAVELFQVETPEGHRLIINELAMRPHNSGHWTIEGAVTSQFEQHLRAVLDYPLGATTQIAPAVVMANVLAGAPGGMSVDERIHHLFARDPSIKVHLYGKEPRTGRKIGHVTALGENMAAVRPRAARAAVWLADGVWSE